MFLTGPEVVKTVTQETISQEELGGAKTHESVSGVCDKSFENDLDLLLSARDFINYLPSNNKVSPPRIVTEDTNNQEDLSLNTLVPSDPNKAYDMKEIIYKLVDDENFFEIQEEFAKNIVVGLGRVNGTTVGVVGNQPLVLAGCLDINSSIKAARFVRF